MPSPEEPLTGGCNCGAVTFAVTSEFTDVGYCHCKRCQRRTGSLWSLNAFLPSEFVEVTGREHLKGFRPAGGNPKTFCAECGSHLFAGMPGETELVGIR